MKRISSLVLILAFSAGARDEYTRAFDKTIALRPGERISLEHRFGDIAIRTHPQQDVVIHADIRVSASDATQAKAFADRIEIAVDPSPSELSIRTRYPERGDSFMGMRNVSYSVRYDITIPETAPLNVRNAFGKVTVAGVKASCDIAASHGSIEFRDGRGTQRLESSFGSVKAANNVGDLTIEGNNGPVDVADITGALSVRNRFANVTVTHVSKGLTVVNSNGSVQATESGGAGNIRNSFGDVMVRGFHGELIVNNSNGKVEATNVDGPAELNTTFGDVRFSGIGHQLSIRATNSRIFGERVNGPLIVQNSFGPVTVSDIQNGVRIQSGNGGVSITNVRGEANVRTSFGMVQATDIGGVLQVENSNGGVQATNTHGAQVTTSFGPVVLAGVTGPVHIEDQNGAVDATSAMRDGCQPIMIHTSFSPLRIRLEDNASYRVAARTSFGKIRTDFPLNVSGSISSDGVDGVIGSGQCEMRLTDSNGSIEILKLGSSPEPQPRHHPHNR